MIRSRPAKHWTAAAILLVSLTAAGCGEDEPPAVCSAVDSLKASVEDVTTVDLDQKAHCQSSRTTSPRSSPTSPRSRTTPRTRTPPRSTPSTRPPPRSPQASTPPPPRPPRRPSPTSASRRGTRHLPDVAGGRRQEHLLTDRRRGPAHQVTPRGMDRRGDGHDECMTATLTPVEQPAAPDDDTTRPGGLTREQVEELGRELDRIRQDVIESRGERDAAYIRRVIKTQRLLELGSRLVLLGGRNKAAWAARHGRPSPPPRSSTTWRSGTTSCTASGTGCATPRSTPAPGTGPRVAAGAVEAGAQRGASPLHEHRGPRQRPRLRDHARRREPRSGSGATSSSRSGTS